MANPKQKRQKKIRYGTQYNDVSAVKHTFHLTTPVTPKMRYRSGEHDAQPNKLIEEILEALGKTAEFQYIRKLMADRTPVGLPGGEAACEDSQAVPTHQPGSREEAVLKEKQDRYARLCRPEASLLHYQKPREASGEAERYEARQQANVEVTRAYDAYAESRRGITDRACKYAKQHGTNYETALAAIGESIPKVKMPTAVAC